MTNIVERQILCSTPQFKHFIYYISALTVARLCSNKQNAWSDLGYDSALLFGIVISAYHMKGCFILDVRHLGTPTSIDKTQEWINKIRKIIYGQT